MMAEDGKCRALLSEHGWTELDEALEPYVQNGAFRRYVSSNALSFQGALDHLSFTPSQVQSRDWQRHGWRYAKAGHEWSILHEDAP